MSMCDLRTSTHSHPSTQIGCSNTESSIMLLTDTPIAVGVFFQPLDTVAVGHVESFIRHISEYAVSLIANVSSLHHLSISIVLHRFVWQISDGLLDVVRFAGCTMSM